MEAQHQILRTLRTSEPALLATLGALSGKSRTAVSGIVCEQFGFYDARGRPQRAGCMKALRTLEAENRISLPPTQRALNIAGPRLLDAPVEVPERVNQLQELEIVCVRSAQDRAIWNTLMDGSIRGALRRLRVHSCATCSRVRTGIWARSGSLPLPCT